MLKYKRPIYAIFSVSYSKLQLRPPDSTLTRIPYFTYFYQQF